MIKKYKEKYFDNLSNNKREISVNIFYSFSAKAISLAVTFLSVPLFLSYLGKETYGVWLTIFSVISWMSFFDLGLGNGLRNHLTHTFAKNDYNKAKEYISTAYFSLGLFIFFSIIFLQFGVFYIDWIKVFKPTFEIGENFNIIVSICLWGFGALLVVKLIISILQSMKQTGIGDLLTALSSFFSLVCLFFISHFQSTDKLYSVAWIFSWTTPIILFIFSVYYLGYKNEIYKPTISKFRLSLAKDIFGLGLGFFAAQFLILILNQSSSIIIIQVLSPTDVTIYSVAARLFSIFTIIMGLVATNLLPYFTEAGATRDLMKMRKITTNFFKLLLILTAFFFIILFFSESLIKVWTSNQIKIPFELLALQFILVIVGGINSILVTVLNGVGKIKIQLPVYLFSVLIFIPSAFYLGEHYKLSGIVVGTICSQLPITFILYYQVKKYFKELSSVIIV